VKSRHQYNVLIVVYTHIHRIVL